LAEQAAAGSIAMSEQSTNMTQLISFFKVNSSGDAAIKKSVVSTKSLPVKTQVVTAKRLEPKVTVIQKPIIASSDEWEEF